MSKIDDIVSEFDAMSVEEYKQLFEECQGYPESDIPKSDFKRTVSISSCRECPYLIQIGEYMVTSCFECEKTKQKTELKTEHASTKEVRIELYKMFENCSYLNKEIK